MPPVEVSSFKGHRESFQMMLHRIEDFSDHLLTIGEIVVHSEATLGFSAILKEEATGVFCHGHIDAEIKSFMHRSSFVPGLGWPLTRIPEEPRLVIRTLVGWMHSFLCCSRGILDWWNILRVRNPHRRRAGRPSREATE